VDVVLSLEVRRDLGPGDELETEARRLGPRLGQAGQSVVIGQREGLDPGHRHLLRQLRR
jgi:hypothetical protein